MVYHLGFCEHVDSSVALEQAVRQARYCFCSTPTWLSRGQRGMSKGFCSHKEPNLLGIGDMMSKHVFQIHQIDLA